MKQEWQTLKVFWERCELEPVSPLLRLLLSSDGTAIRSFNSLFLNLPELEVLDQHETFTDDDQALQLEIPQGEKVLERSVCLSIRRDEGIRERLLFAISSFPVSRLKLDVYQDLQLRQKPLGQIVEERSLSTFRDCLEIAHLPFPKIAEALELKEDTLFWARRFRLSISGQVSASICEVFSPYLSSFSS